VPATLKSMPQVIFRARMSSDGDLVTLLINPIATRRTRLSSGRRVHQRERAAAHGGIDDEPFDSRISDTTRSVRETRRSRKHGLSARSQGTMADLPATRAPDRRTSPVE